MRLMDVCRECALERLTLNRARRLDDEDLDSGDDEDRPDRVMKSIEGGYDEEEESGEENARIMDVHIGRHAQPETTNGEVGSIGEKSKPC